MPILRLVHVNQDDAVTNCVVPINLMKNSLATLAIIAIEEQHFFRVLSQRHNCFLFLNMVHIAILFK